LRGPLRESNPRQDELGENSPFRRNDTHRPGHEEHHETRDQTWTTQGQERRHEDESEEEAGEAETRSAQGEVAAPSGLPKFVSTSRPRATTRGRFLSGAEDSAAKAAASPSSS